MFIYKSFWNFIIKLRTGVALFLRGREESNFVLQNCIKLTIFNTEDKMLKLGNSNPGSILLFRGREEGIDPSLVIIACQL